MRLLCGDGDRYWDFFHRIQQGTLCPGAMDAVAMGCEPPVFERASAAATRSAILGGKMSGHWFTAWYEMPIALAAAVVFPPSNSMAFDFCIAY